MSTGNRPIVLAGFMASGKSTVGRLLARRLGFEFVDLDRLIESETGATIAQFFAERGEAAFRAVEADLLNRLLSFPGVLDSNATVIAVGGGAVMNPVTRRALLRQALVINLTASVDEILKRAGDVRSRPLLNVEDPRARIETLMRERSRVYAELHYSFDSTGMKAPDVAEQLFQVVRAERARFQLQVPISPVHPSATHDYDIAVGECLIDHLGHALVARSYAQPLAVVTDATVGANYAAQVQHALNSVSIGSFVVTMCPGESAKNLESVDRIYASFASNGLSRDGAVIALGGGVVGDTAGFAAATWMRGLALIQIPTSLLAMADSSIGGKVGVDAPFGKNLIGAFKQPDLVVLDLATLRTLPQDELSCGWAEIIKAAFISGRMSFEDLERDILGSWISPRKAAPALMEAIHLKRAIVQEDPFEHGRRAWLNLGHTFGHAIEWWSGFTIKHGQAVALGMVCAFNLAVALGLSTDQWLDKLFSLLKAARLPLRLADLPAAAGLEFDSAKVCEIMQSDKKKKGGKLRFVLLRAPGDLVITPDVDISQIRHALTSIL